MLLMKVEENTHACLRLVVDRRRRRSVIHRGRRSVNHRRRRVAIGVPWIPRIGIRPEMMPTPFAFAPFMLSPIVLSPPLASMVPIIVMSSCRTDHYAPHHACYPARHDESPENSAVSSCHDVPLLLRAAPQFKYA